MSNVLRVYDTWSLPGSGPLVCESILLAMRCFVCIPYDGYCDYRPDVEEVDGGQKNFMLEEMKKLKEKVRDT